MLYVNPNRTPLKECTLTSHLEYIYDSLDVRVQDFEFYVGESEELTAALVLAEEATAVLQEAIDKINSITGEPNHEQI